MSPPSKRRKTAVATKISSSTGSQQRGIQAFGKISKAQVDRTITGKSNSIETEQPSELKSKATQIGLKRKRVSISQSPEGKCPGYLPEPAAKAQAAEPVLAATTPRKQAKTHSAITETPTRGARAILEAFSLQPSSPSTRSSSPPQSHTNTPPTSPSGPRSPDPLLQSSGELPDELQDLIDLYASFLTALSLHYAHNGTLAPVDLRELCPSVARVWRRRAVSVEDIQRILAVAQQDLSNGAGSFCLSDYGHGKICLEAVECHLEGPQRKLADTEALNDSFRQKFEQQWSTYTASNSSSQYVKTFISALPLLPVGTCTSLAKLTPMLAKGQRRLDDLKAGAIRPQRSSSLSTPRPSHSQSSPRPKLATSRSDSLLSRIRAKETVQSTLPPPPSAAMLERISALNRLEEITPVLEILTSATKDRTQQNRTPLGNPQLQTQTQSFTMPTLVQYLQMSLRNPISKGDAIRCVRLLAELVPEWIGVREVGKCVGVTIRRGGAAPRKELDRRVQCMLEKP